MSVLPLSKLALGKVALYVLGEKQVTFQQTNTELVLAATLANGSPETLFQLSVLLKAFLDAIETDMGLLKELGEVSEVYAPVLLNAEFVLIKRNSAAEQAERALAAKYNKWDGDDKDAPWYPYPEEMDEEFNRYDEHTDIKHNPFLSHWVDVVERIQPVVRANKTSPSTPKWWLEAQGARLLLIKSALGLEDLEAMEQSNPYTVLKQWKDTGCFTDPIDVGPFVDMLKSQGIYSASQIPVTPTAEEMDRTMGALVAREEIIATLNHMHVYPDTATFATWLDYARDECLHFLIRLPVTLKSLDFLTKILTSNVFQVMDISIEAHDVAREYLQHALREIEILGSRPSTPTSPHGDGTQSSRFFRSGTPTFGSSANSVDFHDKEDQARTVGLLIVFLRNIIARGVLDLNEAFLDVQEICIRYIWVPQVREFRVWLEEATGVEAFGGGVMLAG